MTTRWTSLKSCGLSLAVCAVMAIGLTARAQLDADSDLTGASSPAATAPTNSAPSASSAAPSSSSAVSAAAAASKKASVTSGKRTSIDFEDELIEGQTQKPELFYLLQKRQFNYKRMIRLRENFLPEMRKTAEEIQRKGIAD